MNATQEIPQQINDLIEVASSIRDEPGVNEARTGAKSDADLTQAVSLSVLVLHLARAQRKHPKPDLITMLIGQCKRYGVYPDMGPKILETIEAIETAA